MTSRPPRVVHGLFLLLVALLFPGCAGWLAPPLSAWSAATPPGAFEVGRDTFAFPNQIRAEHPERAVDFGNYCIIMARAASQFFRFARFAPDAPPVSDAEYTRLARTVMSIGAWAGPRPPERRVVIPGYADLHALSQARESAVKAAFDSNTLSMFHWRTWRIVLPLLPGHQRRLARELVEELAGGRPVPLMITNFPDPDLLNHAVLVYDYRPGARAVEFFAYDPNDPTTPLGLHFDPVPGSFWVEPLPYSPPGRIRAFRLYTSPLL
jgi:hypothetical protein